MKIINRLFCWRHRSSQSHRPIRIIELTSAWPGSRYLCRANSPQASPSQCSRPTRALDRELWWHAYSKHSFTDWASVRFDRGAPVWKSSDALAFIRLSTVFRKKRDENVFCNISYKTQAILMKVGR